MSKLIAFWNWVKKYWKVPLIIGGIVLGWLLFRKFRGKGTPIKQTKTELAVIDATSEVRAKEAELGATEARKFVEAKYANEIKALDEKQRLEAGALRANPAKLAEFLVRAGSDQ